MRYLLVSLLLALAACGSDKPAPEQPDRLILSPSSFDRVPGWDKDRQAAALAPLKRSCERLMRQEPSRPVGPDGLAGTVGDWKSLCGDLAALPAQIDDCAARTWFERWFTPMTAASAKKSPGLFTGYYEAELQGSRTPGPGFAVPIYKRPPELVTVELGDFRADWKGQRIGGEVKDGRLVPYPDRAQVQAGALKGRNLELLWAADPIDVFFLEIQGSGRVVLPDGQVVRVGYAAQNGRPYVAIGRDLADRNAIPRDKVSMQTIRAWLASHPAEAPEVMAKNPSVVFFRELQGEGPLGAQGVALTPGRSLAVDPNFLPLGAPVWLDLDEPKESGGVLRRLVIAQDTGGAIRGPIRGDLFWGAGQEATERAGEMKQPGRLHLLLPKSVARRRPAEAG